MCRFIYYGVYLVYFKTYKIFMDGGCTHQELRGMYGRFRRLLLVYVR
jgi:hypothetical protein